jgi:5'-methylthioadenosine phosphorylase
MEGLTNREEIMPQTPFGAPSDAIVTGMLGEQPIAFVPRHGRGHRLSPTEVPSRANIYALKALGVEWIISVSAVGSLREDYAPLDLVVPDQIFDRTRSRPNSFFEDGVVAHVSFADPFCPHLSDRLWTAMDALGDFGAHRGGVYVCMEGPQFSTKAESNTYRKLGFDLIGMTSLPEAKLAREAEICYATVACVTDYDVWRESAESVTVEMVVANLTRNIENAKRIIRAVAANLPETRAEQTCGCEHALAHAVLTDRSQITAPLRAKYGLLLGKYLAS